MDSSQRINDRWIAFGIWLAMFTSMVVTSGYILNTVSNLFPFMGQFQQFSNVESNSLLIYLALIFISVILLFATWIHLGSTTTDLLIQFASSDLGNETVFQAFIEFGSDSEDDQSDSNFERNIVTVAKTTLPGRFIALLGLTWLVYLLSFPAYAVLLY